MWKTLATSGTRSPTGAALGRGGDVVGFPRGPEGGHQIRNESDELARVLIVSTNADPDVAEYDSGKVGIWIGGQGRFFRVEDAVEHGGPD